MFSRISATGLVACNYKCRSRFDQSIFRIPEFQIFVVVPDETKKRLPFQDTGRSVFSKRGHLGGALKTVVRSDEIRPAIPDRQTSGCKLPDRFRIGGFFLFKDEG